MQKGFKRNFEPIRILNGSQVEQLHSSTLQVLDEIGFKYESGKALKVLEERGCIVDYDTKIARIPPDIVEWAIRKTPSSFMVRARDPEKSIRLGGNTVYFMNSAGARYADVDTGKVSMPTLKQNNEAVIVSDALDSPLHELRIEAEESDTPKIELSPELIGDICFRNVFTSS